MSAWTKQRWDTSLDTVAMVDEALRRGVPRHVVALALAPCVRRCFAEMPAAETRHLDALALVEVVARRPAVTQATAIANTRDLYCAIRLADQLADDIHGGDNADPLQYVGDATKHVAMFLYDGFKPPSACLINAARAMTYGRLFDALYDISARVADMMDDATRAEVLRRMADIVRKHLTWGQLVQASSGGR